MKRRFIRILYTLCAVYIILSIFIIKNSDKHIYVYHEPSNLSIRYGESQYSVIVQNTKVSLEKVTKEKFYITYSQVTGNQSYFGLTLIIENLEKKRINKAAFEYIYIEDAATKQKYYPIPYFEIENFPQDQPMLYKAKFYAKFHLLPYNIFAINIYFKFEDKLFILKNVDIR
ncbi:hypothetical protein Calkro_1423 [Caldicellulosiruptor kronotskyensis 2002]|uniref:DUF4352 domain-containing protein n=1 Tax=Caldicellulosiruptor kronotskyensis (strain DSM 18902 / VKM B-2412 / 2002) TaxID=632348 RepID=E4SC44_CALK2|nr:hypothetical protein [Caldicellulosiruptor kronotskyensis]ADQ46279.1 hypothetical protein Calkro_1423 [Caldicellulosiruptor kronotskyensis 2002]